VKKHLPFLGRKAGLGVARNVAVTRFQREGHGFRSTAEVLHALPVPSSRRYLLPWAYHLRVCRLVHRSNATRHLHPSRVPKAVEMERALCWSAEKQRQQPDAFRARPTRARHLGHAPCLKLAGRKCAASPGAG